MLFFRSFSRLPSPAIPFGQCMTLLPGYSGGRPVPADRLSRSSAKKCPVPSDGLCPESRPFSFRLPSNELPPFAQRQGFWHPTPPANQAAGHPGFLLQTVTSFLRPGLRHYYGFICHLAPLRSTLSLLLSLAIRRLHGTIQGFPSYLGLPVNYATLNHSMGLTRYRASRYFARSPTSGAESGSLALCAVHSLSLPSDPAVTSNALAIRIVFPLVGATPVSCNRPGLPATLGKQKRGQRNVSFDLRFFRSATISRRLY
jgi:hypothetical protein